jgi:hypothetical protein
MYHGDRDRINKVYALSMPKIFVSSCIKKSIQKDLSVEGTVLLNTVDKKLFHPLVGEKSNSVNILLLCHDYEWKGTKEGVEIVNDLKKKYPNIKLWLFGSRQKETTFDCDRYYYGLFRENLAELYAKSDIFLCTSWDEGFGLPSLEAMACKCAVATYDNGGSRDFAFDGQTALVAKRKDKEELKNKLELLIKDKELRDKIAEGAYQFVQKMPTWEQQADKLEKILKGIINNYEQN